MLKAKEVKIVSNTELDAFQNELNRLLTGRDPWTLHGDLKVIWGSSQFTYVQAVVRLEPMEMPGMGQVMPGGVPLIMPRG